jgi:hypothetical protein
MRLYHSSSVVVERPDLDHSRKYLDFGRGFYLTSILKQAQRYGDRFKRRGKDAWLNAYEFSYDETEWKVLRFDAYDKAWLDFISKCRAGEDDSNYDLVIGGIANDRVFLTLDRYLTGEITLPEALGLLKFVTPNIQYCVRSEEMLHRCLTYVESERL